VIGSAEGVLSTRARPSFGGLTQRTAELVRAHPDVTALVGLFAAALAFYYPLVFLGRALVDYDAFVYFYPQRVYLAHALLSGRIPLWDPDLFLGAPFLANPQTAALYPPSWLFLLGPVHAIYGAQLVLHGLAAAFFTYLLARRAFAVEPLAAAIGGLAFAFGGFAVAQVGHLNQISAAAWLPAVLLCFDRLVATRSPRWVALGACALALQLFAGHPQDTYMTLIVLGAFGVLRTPWSSMSGSAWAVVGGSVMCGLGAVLAAAQLLPTLELAPLSIRGEGVNWRDAVAGSLPDYLAVRALLPPFWIRVPYTEYLGYVGVTPVVLGFLALLHGRARWVTFAALVSFLGLFLALGENNGFYSLLFSSVPGFDTFRVPARWLLLWMFGVALLSALGADWIARGARVMLRQPRVWIGLLVVVVILATGLAWQGDAGEPFAARRTPLAFVAIAVLALAFGALPHLGRPRLALALLLTMTGAELWAVSGESPARQAPPAAFTDGQVVDWLQAHGVTNQERLLSMARPEYVPVAEPLVRASLGNLPDQQVASVLVAQKWHDTLTPNLPLQFGLNTADGYDGGVLPLLRWLHLSSILVDSPRPDGVLLTRLERIPPARLLDLLGVRYVIANAGVTGPSEMQVVDFGDLRLFVRPNEVPRSLVVFNATPVADEREALARLAQTDFDPNREVVLEGTPLATRGPAAVGIQPDPADPQRWRAHVSMPQPGYLLQREAYYPGWRARVDGVDVPVLRADAVFRAVHIPAGEHDVDLFFDSESFTRGALISLAGLIVIILVLAGPFVPRMGVRVQSG
jgi:Bacterial membrane protein YfhO